MEFDDRIGPLAVLVGTWSGAGEGVYPTIESFAYTEEISFTDPQVKPFLAYAQRTRHATEGRPLHTEAGYLRWAAGAPEWVVVSPTGVAEVHQGMVEQVEDAVVFRFATTAVAATATAKEVTSVARELRVHGDELGYELWMGAVGQPHQLHLRATLHRSSTGA